MKKIYLAILFILVLSISLFAQTVKPILSDEFGPLALGDLSSRIEGLRSELESNENSRALIRIYGGTNDSIAFPYVRKAFYEAYFSNFKSAVREKLTVQICDSDEIEIRNQLFIMSPNAKIEECESGFKIPQQTQIISSEEVYDEKYEKLLGSVDGYLGTKGVDKATAEAGKNFIAELLTKSPDGKIYLIGYAGRYFKPAKDESEDEIFSKADSLKVNDKTLKRIKNEFTRKGIDPSRIVTVRGGYSNHARKIEYYFVPNGGEIPTPKPDYSPKKKQK